MPVTLVSTGVTFPDLSIQGTDANNILKIPPAIGSTTANAGSFTNLTSNTSPVLTNANFNNVVVGGANTLSSGQRYFVSAGTAANVTLPATPAVGSTVTIGVDTGITGCWVLRNGQNIMKLAQDMNIDIGNVSVTLEYVDATFGWRII
jgi:hypothetical protein